MILFPPGKIVDPGSTVLPVNKAGFKLNSALHELGHNIVYHTHSHAGTAVSIHWYTLFKYAVISYTLLYTVMLVTLHTLAYDTHSI